MYASLITKKEKQATYGMRDGAFDSRATSMIRRSSGKISLLVSFRSSTKSQNRLRRLEDTKEQQQLGVVLELRLLFASFQDQNASVV